MNRIYQLLFILLAGSATICAQDLSNIEDLLGNAETDDEQPSSLLLVLQALQENPLKLQSATLGELLQIPFLDHQNARQIIRYRRKAGIITGYRELSQKAGISPELLAAIRPFISLEKAREDNAVYYQLQLKRQLHNIRAFEEGLYHHPLTIFQKFFWKPHPLLNVGFLWQKDAGEARILDFGSAYLSYQNQSWHFYLGDYVVRSGQRLALSGAYGTPFSLEDGSFFRRQDQRWRPKRSADENAFLRGVHLGWRDDRSSLALFFSSNQIDASLNDDSTLVKSFYTSGYHRTPSEESKRDRLGETVIGVTADHQQNTWSLGLSAAATRFDLPLLVSGVPDSLQATGNFSLFHSTFYRDLQWQSEIAIDHYGATAIQQVLLLKPEKQRWQYGLMYYRYALNYFARLGRGAGQASASPNNKSGIYLNIRIAFGANKLSCFFQTDRPLSRQDRFIYRGQSWQAQWLQRIQKSKLTIRYSRRQRRDALPGIYPHLLYHALRLNLLVKHTNKLQLQSRIEISSDRPWRRVAQHHGVSLFADVRYQLLSSLRLQLRWTQFQTANFDQRIYEFEAGIPGSFDNILLNGRGYKWFLRLDWKSRRHWQVVLRYRMLYYPDLQMLGSGPNTISGNRKQEVALHIRFKA